MSAIGEVKADLLPCPFCGGKAKACNYITEGAVRCEDCGARVSYMHESMDDTGTPEAIARWNGRA